jgi:hypothetical protein
MAVANMARRGLLVGALAVGVVLATASGAAASVPSVGTTSSTTTTSTTSTSTTSPSTTSTTSPPPPGTKTTTTSTTAPQSHPGAKRSTVSRSAAGAPHTASASTPLVGTFKLQAGSCAHGETGSYFRMVIAGKAPGGPDGSYLSNSNSTCSDHTYTLFQPGTSGGLVTGGYQPEPSPAFDKSGNSLADQIIQPVAFYGVKFSVSTESVDPQTKESVPVPSLSVNSSGDISGNLEAWNAAWNANYFNQGSPKPGGATPGFTSGPTGTYNSSTGAFAVSWTSQIVTGPFNSFTGQWHLVGTFKSGTSSTTPSGGSSTTGTLGGSGGSGSTLDAASSTGSTGSGTGSPGGSDPGSGGGTLPLTGLEVPLWLPLPLLALGAVLLIPPRRSWRTRKRTAR